MDHSKKICILNHGLASGGTDSFVITLAQGLVNDGYYVAVALAVDDDSAPQYRENEVMSMGIEVFKTSDLDGIKKVFCHCRKLYSFLKRERFDVFHSNMDLFNGINLLVAWLARIPIRVSYSHTTNSQYETRTKRHMAVHIYRRFMKRLLWTFSNRRCGCSAAAMDYLYDSKWEQDSLSKIVYNGINFSRFSRKDFDRQRTKQELNLPQGSCIICVGALSRIKNPILAVRIMEQLRQTRSDIHLLWIGDGELRQQVEQYIVERDLQANIHLLGVQRNIPDYLRCSDLFLMTSLFEGLPIAAIEAQAAGLPCVLTDTISNSVNIGMCRFLPLDSDLSVWCQTLLNLLDGNTVLCLDDDRRKLFDDRYMIKQIETVYEQ